MKPVVWGVLSSARIGLDRVIPAMQKSACCEVRAIASRDGERARTAARTSGIERHYESYEALLADPAIEAVYIPLPNHLHVEWSMRALEAGKHVLCEKPIACRADEVAPLLQVRDRTGLLVEEAVMVRDHPQWSRLRDLIDSGRIGALHTVQMSYAHTNDDPQDIRNSAETGGGGIYDVGCYCVSVARLIFQAEPLRAFALANIDARFGIDRWSTALLEFAQGHASFFCSMQSSRYQMVQIIGSEGWVRIEVPFAHPPSLAARMVIGRNEVPGTEPNEIIPFEALDQYQLQAERFCRQIRGHEPSRWPLETAVDNMRVIDALYASARSGMWSAV